MKIVTIFRREMRMLAFEFRRLRHRYIKWRCKRAKKYLMFHDSDFALQEAQMQCVQARNQLYRDGVDPLSNEIPSVRDFIDPDSSLGRAVFGPLPFEDLAAEAQQQDQH